MGAESYISYGVFRTAVDELEKTGVAPCITLPFAARQGHVVNIDGREYRLEAPVTSESVAGCGRTVGGDDVVGFRASQL